MEQLARIIKLVGFGVVFLLSSTLFAENLHSVDGKSPVSYKIAKADQVKGIKKYKKRIKRSSRKSLAANKLSKSQRITKRSIKNSKKVAKKSKPKIKVLKRGEFPRITKQKWRYADRKFKVQYYSALREAFVRMNKEFQKSHKNLIVDLKYKNKIDSIMKFFANEAFARNFEEGQPCLYAGTPSTFVMWSNGRVYCTPPGADGNGIGPGEMPANTFNGRSFCENSDGTSLSEQRVLCNPALWGLGSNGQGYCTTRGGSAFSGCQSLYYADKPSGGGSYGTAEIASQIASEELGGAASVQAMQDFFAEYCVDSVPKTTGMATQCNALLDRIERIKAKWPGEFNVESGTNVADDAPAETGVTAKSVCAPRVTTFEDGSEHKNYGVGGCLACALDMSAAKNVSAEARVSHRYLDMVTILNAQCNGRSQENDATKAMEIVQKLGYCTEQEFNYEGASSDVYDAAHNLSKSPNRGTNTEDRRIQALFGVSRTDLNAAFCENGGGVKSSDEIISGLQAFAAGDRSGTEGETNQARQSVISCLEKAKERIEVASACSVTDSGHDSDENGFWNVIMANAEAGRPSINQNKSGNCETITGLSDDEAHPENYMLGFRNFDAKPKAYFNYRNRGVAYQNISDYANDRESRWLEDNGPNGMTISCEVGSGQQPRTVRQAEEN